MRARARVREGAQPYPCVLRGSHSPGTLLTHAGLSREAWSMPLHGEVVCEVTYGATCKLICNGPVWWWSRLTDYIANATRARQGVPDHPTPPFRSRPVSSAICPGSSSARFVERRLLRVKADSATQILSRLSRLTVPTGNNNQ